MTICVMLFYSFLSISSSYYQPDIGSEYDFTILSDGMKIAICVITLFLLFLIRFVNNYMLRRRQKEFAVQAIMGMISIAAGIILGVFCSQFITAMLLTSYGEKLRTCMDTVPGYSCSDGWFLCSEFFCGRAVQHMHHTENQTYRYACSRPEK